MIPNTANIRQDRNPTTISEGPELLLLGSEASGSAITTSPAGVQVSNVDDDDDSASDETPQTPLDLSAATPPITVQVTFRGNLVPVSRRSQVVSHHPSITKAKDGRIHQGGDFQAAASLFE